MSVFEYHRRCAAAGASALPSDPGAAPLLIDLGNTALLAAGDVAASQYAAWDREDAPDTLLRQLAEEFGGPLAGAGTDPDIGVLGAPEAVGRSPWLHWPRVVVRQDATLSVSLSIEPPSSSARPAADTAAGAGKRRRPGDDDAAASRLAALDPAPVDPAAAHICVVGLLVTRGSVFLAGRYVKLARGLSQSSWFLQGKR